MRVISETPVSMALTDWEWAILAFESAHISAITLVVGSIALIDLRLLNLGLLLLAGLDMLVFHVFSGK